jgi:hypothetical protein
MRWLKLFPAVVVTGATLAFLWAPGASAVNFTSEACKDAAAKNSSACSSGSRYEITGSNGIIARAANLIAIVSAVAAVIMIILGGFNLITAAGDSGKIGSGKKMITYAIVGLIVIALARTIVVFVVSRL